MKKLLLALCTFIGLGLGLSPALAQCNGVFGANTACGTVGGGFAGPVPFSSITGNGITALTGDVTATGPGSVAATLATVNANVGSFGSATLCTAVTVNAKGLITAASAVTCTPSFANITNRAAFAQLPQGIANSIYINPTGSTADMQAIAVPACANDGAHGLVYVNGTGLQCATLTVGGTVTSVQVSAGSQIAVTGTCTITLSGNCTVAVDQTSGVKKLLATLTASNTAILSDTTSITGTYNTYELVFTAIIPATNGAAPQLQIHSGGTFKSTGYINACIDASAAVGICAANTVNIGLGFNSTATDATNNPRNATPGMSGAVRLYNPSAAQITMTNAQIGYLNAAGTAAFIIINDGFWNTSGAIDGFQFAFNTGNITSGTIKIYGWN